MLGALTSFAQSNEDGDSKRDEKQYAVKSEQMVDTDICKLHVQNEKIETGDKQELRLLPRQLLINL